MPDVIPRLAYEDTAQALDWLPASGSATTNSRYMEPDGRISHAEMDVGNGVIMLATPTPAYQSPKRHRDHANRACLVECAWVINGVLVYVTT